MEAPFLIGDMSPSSFPSLMPMLEASHLIVLLKGLHSIIFLSFPCVISTFILSYMVKMFQAYELIVFLLHVEGTS
jgi:hypothetical protein